MYSKKEALFFVFLMFFCMSFVSSANSGTTPSNVSVPDTIAPNVTINTPLNATTYVSNNLINISLNENGSCKYSLDAGTTNNSLTASADNREFTKDFTGISNGNYLLNVYCNDSFGNQNYTEFVNFTINFPAAPVTPGGGGGGGGGRTIETFTIDRDLIEVSLKQGESKREQVSIENTGNVILNFVINSTNLDNHLIISEKSFFLEPGEIKIINFDFFAGDKESPEVYAGNIVISMKDIKKTINVVTRVQERNPLFDIKAELLSKKILKGDDLDMNINIYNLGDLKNIDVLLYYSIIDFENRTLAYREESLAIDEHLKLFRTISPVPELEYGNYVLYAKVSYENITAVSSYAFKVTTAFDKYSILFWIIILLLILIILLIIRKIKKDMEKRRE